MAREVGQVRRPASLSASNVRSSRSAWVAGAAAPLAAGRAGGEEGQLARVQGRGLDEPGPGEPAFAPQQVVRAGEALPLAGVGLAAVADDAGLVIAVEPALQG